ncbi:ADP compounds hydrolase NudE [Shewanella sp. OPT22]|uniref:ADP compounds hydrolase NudE n=1 Tax=Parashewanella hymeniacidonis TaxID=2807618 RepID=UPI0010223DCA|nr:ADP compounds hydrolase NudE [Parashewanella hymeniacidonis]RYV03693.1 ADP compounds hydrolase NudE [Shewanella sp. OPT22]
MSKQHQKPIINDSKVVAKSRLFTIEQLDLTFSNGVKRQYERMKGISRGAVMIVPIKDGQLLLAREYAAGTHDYELGFPKGLIDPGETPEQAANRELQEEIGYGAKKLTFLKEVSLAPSYFSSKMSLYIAEGLYESKLEGDEPEPIEVIPWDISNWKALLEAAHFTEARCVSALFLAMTHIKKK